MKKYLAILLPIIFIIGCISQQKVQNSSIMLVKTSEKTNKCDCVKDCISIYYKNKFVDNIQKKCFEEMVKSVGILSKIQMAEKNENGYKIEIELEDNPWNTKRSQDFNTLLYVKYIDNKGKVFKKITIQAKLKMGNDGDISGPWLLYRQVAEIGFPLSFLLLIIAILL